jgi:hypothetical protein
VVVVYSPQEVDQSAVDQTNLILMGSAADNLWTRKLASSWLVPVSFPSMASSSFTLGPRPFVGPSLGTHITHSLYEHCAQHIHTLLQRLSTASVPLPSHAMNRCSGIAFLAPLGQRNIVVIAGSYCCHCSAAFRVRPSLTHFSHRNRYDGI